MFVMHLGKRIRLGYLGWQSSLPDMEYNWMVVPMMTVFGFHCKHIYSLLCQRFIQVQGKYIGLLCLDPLFNHLGIIHM